MAEEQWRAEHKCKHVCQLAVGDINAWGMVSCTCMYIDYSSFGSANTLQTVTNGKK